MRLMLFSCQIFSMLPIFGNNAHVIRNSPFRRIKWEFYLSFLDGAEEPKISNKPTIILPKSIPPVEIRTSLQIKGLPNRNLNNGKVIMTPMA